MLSYQLPFVSSGNMIALTVVNMATAAPARVKVEASHVPTWLKFNVATQRISTLKWSQELPVTFTFAVDKTVPVDRRDSLKFAICARIGESWTKEITVAVSAPEKFEACQDFPNPFNLTTAISRQLSAV